MAGLVEAVAVVISDCDVSYLYYVESKQTDKAACVRASASERFFCLDPSGLGGETPSPGAGLRLSFPKNRLLLSPFLTCRYSLTFSLTHTLTSSVNPYLLLHQLRNRCFVVCLFVFNFSLLLVS